MGFDQTSEDQVHFLEKTSPKSSQRLELFASSRKVKYVLTSRSTPVDSACNVMVTMSVIFLLVDYPPGPTPT